MTFSAVNTIWVLLGGGSGVLYAGRLFHVRGRIYPGQKHR